MRFTKMHGIGNDFVVVDATSSFQAEGPLDEVSRQVCDRRFGVGADGLILVERGDQSPFRMRMFNPDGSESEMCGNGVRCVAKFIHDRGLDDAAVIPIDTGAGRLELELIGERVRVDMGLARLTRGEIGITGDPHATFVNEPFEAEGHAFRGTAVSMGNPHVVMFVPDVEAVPLESWGPAIEHHALFPRRVNAHFVQVVDRTRLIQRTWERGAGITLACGTGACACAVASVLNDYADRRVTIRLPGGELEIEYREDGRVFMTGPAETVFEGEWRPNA